MSGETVVKTSNGSSVLVKNLHEGVDQIQGLDKDKQVNLQCKVEAVGTWGEGSLYGGYTADHFVYKPDIVQHEVRVHGYGGIATIEAKYQVLTSCPVAMDTKHNLGFTVLDGDFCGTTSLTWTDYTHLHAAILALVRASGSFWFASSSYTNLSGMMAFARSNVCQAMLQCAKHQECEKLEAAAVYFVNNFLEPPFKAKTLSSFPQMGMVGAQGSVSSYVMSS